MPHSGVSEERFWFRCPCGVLITIDPNQFMGHVPINHPSCGYYAQGIVTPGIRADVPPGPDIQTRLTPIM